MPSKDPAQRLSDIAENIEAIRDFTAGLDFDTFRADRKTIYAVIRALEIISEASRRLPEELRRRHPEFDWAAIAAAGNIYRHEYEVIDEALIWHTVQHGLGALLGMANEELRRLKAGEPSASGSADGLLP